MPSALRSSENEVTAFDTVWHVEADTAAQWLAAFRADDEHLAGIFPGLLVDDDVDRMSQMWLEYDDAAARCERAARKLLSRASGMDWVWAYNLMQISLRGWLYVNGVLLRQNVNSHSTSLSDWLMAAYTMLYEGRDETGRVALETEMMTPPRGVRLVIPASVQHQGALAFAMD
jgi:hypothetical protein